MKDETFEESNLDNPETGALFITIVICVILIVLAAGLAYNLGQANPFSPEPQGATLTLEPTELAKKEHFENAKVVALVNLNNGFVRLTIHPDDSFILPQNSTLEGFLVDAGTVGDFGTSSETVADEYFGSTLSNDDVDKLSDQVPYALSIGKVKQDNKTKDYYIDFNVQNTLIPFDQIVLTLEGDANRTDYDPRPAAIVFQAGIPDNLKPRKALVEANQPSNVTNSQ